MKWREMEWREGWRIFFGHFLSVLPRAVIFVVLKWLVVVLPTFLLFGPKAAVISFVACTVVGVAWGGIHRLWRARRGIAGVPGRS